MVSRSILGLGGLLAAALPLAGCGGLNAGPPSPLPNHSQALEQFAAVYSPDKVAACLALPVAAQRDCRDTIGYALLTAIDLRYAEFEASFFDATRYGGFGTTLVSLGLTSAASVSSVGAANILAALGTGVTGVREAFGRDVLVDRTSAALMTAMRSERARYVLRIRAGLRRQPEDYPLGWALSDLYAYYRAGTLPGALSAVTRAVGAEAQQAQDNVTWQALTGKTLAETRSVSQSQVVPETPAPGAGGTAPQAAPRPPGIAAPRPAPPPPPAPPLTEEERAANACLLRGFAAPGTSGRVVAEMVALGLTSADQQRAFLTRPEAQAGRVAMARRICPLAPATPPPIAPGPSPTPQQ
ncbi:hypothetical protein JYK14_00725 [Siccirubricoccus sp. KC 17139]|uniref:DUF4439 domain-containing protein n=1 Tax=Siccirubricoccus soli TaxID=2899147 RepID=A0ABT1D0B9_9PROT|nr:hypothetical protein [Siccirubricoccus soli]MCO6414704.1 hypothetical protein [Siccirubricoccus soli]MCP2680834.1 hypothetical protein [Siccirubricoccus soli]